MWKSASAGYGEESLLNASTRQNLHRVKQGFVEESPPDQAVYNLVDQFRTHTREITEQFVFQRLIPQYEVSVPVYRTKQLDDRDFALDPKFSGYGCDLFIGKEVNIQREIV